MANILEIKNLNYKYGTTTIFKDFNLSVKENSYISIAGNNTSGKTTLIKLIAGLLPSKNNIIIGYSYVDNNRICDHTKELGIVFGNNLTSFLFEDVYKEMAFPLENLNKEVVEIENKILEIANMFGISKLLDKKTKDLTSLEKQEVLIAISLLHEPKILLLDNAFSMMDRKTKERVKKGLIEYKKKYKLTIILTTTNLEDTLDTDYLYILNKGNIVVEGEPLTVLREDTILNRLGLSLPFMVDLSLKLEFYELIEKIEIDMDRMVDNLWK
jgi:energy-coupling factor transport system ATP-binding protein